MRVGILSDTHGFLDAETEAALRDVEEIWHAGDVGRWGVLDRLERLGKPLRAVWGNIDGPEVRSRTSPYQVFETGGLRVLLVHQAGTPGHYSSEVRQILSDHSPAMIVCGHSHILRVERDEQGILYVNPGACGMEGIHRVRTLLRFEIANGRVTQAEAVEIGTTGSSSREKAWLSVTAFAARRGLKLSNAEASALGRRAARICQEQGWPVNVIPHPRFGRVNEYPLEALEEALRESR